MMPGLGRMAIRVLQPLRVPEGVTNRPSGSTKAVGAAPRIPGPTWLVLGHWPGLSLPLNPNKRASNSGFQKPCSTLMATACTRSATMMVTVVVMVVIVVTVMVGLIVVVMLGTTWIASKRGTVRGSQTCRAWLRGLHLCRDDAGYGDGDRDMMVGLVVVR
jgi:hypothetical protein